ncbi:hypothetical protein [Kitasatospora sp. NPDC059571]|uniref:hypothetical protein n=1 Tax=Kitasatospora sp. NPDC059571 TaxID=3346871 RepID=UPI0036A34125
MSTGSGSSGGSGAGYRVEVDSLRAFASQVRGLLSEFEATAGGTKVHGQSGVGRSAFGTFGEAEALHKKYEEMRDQLRLVLNHLQDAIDQAQRKADVTANNYEEHEHETARSLHIETSDGWSVLGGSSVVTASVRSNAVRSTAPSGPKGPAGAAPAGSGDPQPTW